MSGRPPATSSLRSALGWASLAWAVAFGPIGTGCARGGSPAARPVAREATAGAAPAATPPTASARARSFSPLLAPADGLSCPPAFPHGYRFVGTTESQARQLFQMVWLDGVSRGDYVVPTSPDARDAAAARCFAVGPHRDLNIANWCCR